MLVLGTVELSRHQGFLDSKGEVEDTEPGEMAFN